MPKVESMFDGSLLPFANNAVDDRGGCVSLSGILLVQSSRVGCNSDE